MATDGSEEVLGFDPVEAETDEGFYRQLFRMHDQQIQHCLPCIVTKYDQIKGIVTVRPLVKYIKNTTSGDVYVNRPEYQVRALTFRHGGISIQSPIYVGDTGWLVACDRDSTSAIEKNKAENFDNAKEKNGKFGDNEGPQAPYTDSLPSFMFGYFIPDCWNEAKNKISDGLSITYTPRGGGENGKVNVLIDKNAVKLSRVMNGTVETLSLSDDGIKFDGIIDKTIPYSTFQRYDEKKNALIFKNTTQKMRGGFVVDAETSKEEVEVPIKVGDIPKVYDGKLTIKVNGEENTFTANQEDDTEIDIDFPETSALPISGDAPTSLTDDGVFITQMRYDIDDTHQLQAKARKYNIVDGNIISVSNESEWMEIAGGQCVQY